MKRVYVNEEWCLGCHLCEYYCAFSNSGETNMVRALKDKAIYPRIQVGGDNNFSFAVSCRHCDEPLCVKGCISGALSVSGGVIRLDTEKCVGCYTCILSCPYGAITINADHGVQKCELCPAREGVPACVEGCPNRALVWEERQ